MNGTGKLYRSGTYTFSTLNTEGCDSIINLVLTKNTDLITDLHFACDSFVWIDGNTYYESNDSSFVVFKIVLQIVL